MQSHVFYTKDEESTLPLMLVSLETWKAGMEGFSESEINCIKNQQFTGKCGDIALLYDEHGHCKMAFAGAGEGNEILAMANAATRLPPGRYLPSETLSEVAILQWALAQYRFDAYKKYTGLPRVLYVHSLRLPDILMMSDAIFHVRDLINQPTNAMGPTELAFDMEKLAREYGAEFNQWVGDELLTANFPAIHAVGRAAFDAPRFLKLSYGNVKHPRVVLVGKGVCFDSGGLDIKNASTMRLMKKDMGGAAQVIGLAQWIMAKKLPIRLDVLIPAVENAVGSKSYRPGDVLTMRNGMTVEIDNTDAEGRLVLADALTYACEEALDLLIDFSTLTGAARIAVGTEIAAMFTNNDVLAKALENASHTTSDPLWRLPLYAGYASLLDSSVADISNCSSSAFAGAITAALFMQRFIHGDCPWVHFDIMAWNISNKPGKPEGGEAMGIRAVAEYLLHQYSQVG